MTRAPLEGAPSLMHTEMGKHGEEEKRRKEERKREKRQWPRGKGAQRINLASGLHFTYIQEDRWNNPIPTVGYTFPQLSLVEKKKNSHRLTHRPSAGGIFLIEASSSQMNLACI